jgi:hypothetical protein
LKVNWEFAKPASDEQIERAAKALEESNIRVQIAQYGEEAEKMVFDLLPEGAEVFTASSQTLEFFFRYSLTGDNTCPERSRRFLMGME